MQLNKDFFEKTGLYSKGFVTEPLQFAGRDAILVKGYDAQTPDVQRRDYYYLHNGKLVSVSFKMADDKDNAGKKIFQQVKNTFAALP